MQGSAAAARYVAGALVNLLVSDAGKAACIAAGGPTALVALAASPSVRGSVAAAKPVARALVFIILSDAGKSALIAAGARAVLPACPAVRGSAEASGSVAWAIDHIS